MTAPALPQIKLSSAPKRTLWRDAVRSFSRNRLAMAGLAIVGLLVFCAIFANFIAPEPYFKSDLAQTLQFPSLQHVLGTDPIGRDLLSRLIYGARTSLAVGFSVQLIAFAIGVPLGALAGLRGGWIDIVVTRLIEIMTAFPGLLFALFLMSILGNGLGNIILAGGITSWIDVCRLTRGQLLALREREFVVAARSYGADDWRIMSASEISWPPPSIITSSFSRPTYTRSRSLSLRCACVGLAMN